jgi:hypothetical protein
VIGARGMLGRAVVEQFRAQGWEVQLAGRKDNGGDDFRYIDLDRPETITQAISGADLVVSTVSHPGFTVERMVAEQGGILVNCSHAAGRAAAAITSDAHQPRGTVLLNAGLVPGVANLLAAQLLGQHPQAECLEIAFTVLSSGSAGRAGGEWVHRGLTAKRHHHVVKLPMPEPLGELACIQVTEQDDGGYGAVAGSRRIEIYLGFGDRALNSILRAVNALRLMALLPKAAFASRRGDPSGLSKEPTVVWVGARLGGQRLGASVIQCDGDYRTTAAAARIFGEELLKRGRPGCFNPEDLFSVDDLVGPLGEVGLRIAEVD